MRFSLLIFLLAISSQTFANNLEGSPLALGTLICNSQESGDRDLRFAVKLAANASMEQKKYPDMMLIDSVKAADSESDNANLLLFGESDGAGFHIEIEENVAGEVIDAKIANAQQAQLQSMIESLQQARREGMERGSALTYFRTIDALEEKLIDREQMKTRVTFHETGKTSNLKCSYQQLR